MKRFPSSAARAGVSAQGWGAAYRIVFFSPPRRPVIEEMSNIYVTEPPYSGKVILETNRGDIEVELFAKECPQTCKNFVALALEGYYDNIIWHRVVPDFIIQTGDPTATGLGGESFYGESFADELHQRLRFNRRGLLGMANASQPNSNDSQFFLTLAPTPELQGRHTMFGRISNNTIYNLVGLAENVGEIGDDDRPLFPPKLRAVRVVENPFEGQITLRVTREEREEMKRNRREAEKRKAERERTGDGEKKKKNTSLLSFGQEEDVEDDATFKGPKSSHDLLKNDKRLLAEAVAARSAPTPAKVSASSANGIEGAHSEKRRKRTDEDEGTSLAELRSQHSSKSKTSTAEAKIAALEASIRALSQPQTSVGKETEKKGGKGKDLLQEYRDKYKKSSLSSRKKDEETADRLSLFQKRLRAQADAAKREEQNKQTSEEDAGEVPEEMREYGASDGEDDEGNWRNHRFDFGGKAVADDGHGNDVSGINALRNASAHDFSLPSTARRSM